MNISGRFLFSKKCVKSRLFKSCQKVHFWVDFPGNFDLTYPKNIHGNVIAITTKPQASRYKSGLILKFVFLS
jgi:hypothetical protein